MKHSDLTGTKQYLTFCVQIRAQYVQLKQLLTYSVWSKVPISVSVSCTPNFQAGFLGQCRLSVIDCFARSSFTAPSARHRPFSLNPL